MGRKSNCDFFAIFRNPFYNPGLQSNLELTWSMPISRFRVDTSLSRKFGILAARVSNVPTSPYKNTFSLTEKSSQSYQ